MFTATLDTSVLWPSLQRDFLLSLAVESAYRPTWSSAIHDGLEFHEEVKLVKRGIPIAEAASRAATGAIVTENLKDFPAAKIPPGMQVLSAREFAKYTVALNPRYALAAVQEIASRSGRYGATLTVEEILDTLRDRYGMSEAVEMIVEAASA